MISTSKEQSRRLLACGVSADTADMIETRLGNLLNRTQDFPVDETKETLVWSLSRMLELMPASILSPTGIEYMLELSKLRMRDAWEIQWFNGNRRLYTFDNQRNSCYLRDKSPIEACVKAIEWLADNGYKLNEIK